MTEIYSSVGHIDEPSLTYWWGTTGVDMKHATEHFLVAGATGSGKSVTIKHLMDSIYTPGPGGLGGEGMRSLIFDAKREFYPVLRAYGVAHEKIHILNPFDARCVQWDLSEDITGFAAAEEFAAILIPEENERSTYFRNTSRLLMAAVIKIFIHVRRRAVKEKGNRGRWTLRDVILALQLPGEALKEFLGSQPFSAHLARIHFQNDETIANVRSTLGGITAQFEVAAALWDNGGDGGNGRPAISLVKHWLRSSSVLLLGREPTLPTALQPLYQAIVHRAIQLVLSLEEKPHGTESGVLSWFFFDEVNAAGKLSTLPDLLKQGRSKGACVVLGIQNLEGLVAVYGEPSAMDLVSQCANRALLTVRDSKTAQWASAMVGEHEIIKKNTSDSTSGSITANTGVGSSGGSDTTGWQKTISAELTHEPVIRPSEFWTRLSPPNSKIGLEGYFTIPGIARGQTLFEIPAEDVFHAHGAMRIHPEAKAVIVSFWEG